MALREGPFANFHSGVTKLKILPLNASLSVSVSRIVMFALKHNTDVKLGTDVDPQILFWVNTIYASSSLSFEQSLFFC